MLTDTYILLGALQMVLATPLMLRLVPPNRWYGIRAFMLEPDRWYSLNRRGGLLLVVAGAAQVVAGSLLHWVVAPLSNQAQIMLTVLLIPIFYTTVITVLIMAGRMLRQR